MIRNSLDPIWRLLIDLPVDDPSTMEDLQVEVWDYDQASTDDFLGRCSVPVTVARTAMASQQTQDVWRKLEGVEKGSIKMEVSWAALTMERPKAQVSKKKKRLQGV